MLKNQFSLIINFFLMRPSRYKHLIFDHFTTIFIKELYIYSITKLYCKLISL